MIKTDGHIFAGVDLGGSKILTVIANHDGAILSKTKLPTPADANGEALTTAIAEGIRSALAQSASVTTQIAGIGIAAAGVIDKESGVIVHSPHLSRIKDFPLLQAISSIFASNVYMANDANMAALAEHKFGAGRGVNEFVFVTISTGIGGGVIVRGQLLEGKRGFAGELGHMSIQIDGPKGRSSNLGAWESLASGSALTRIATECMRLGRESIMREYPLNAKQIFEADRQGDRLATEVLEAGIAASGVALANIANIFDPELIVIGGGVSTEWDRYIDPAIQIMRTRALPPGSCKVRVLPPELGEEAGALGALFLATQDTADI